jgi:hypothetical protein
VPRLVPNGLRGHCGHTLFLAGALLLAVVSSAAGAQREITFEGVPKVASTERLARELLQKHKVLKGSEVETTRMTAFEVDSNSPTGKLLIVRLDDRGFCGTLGCLTFVFVSRAGAWKPIVAENFHQLWLETSASGQARLITDDQHGNRATVDVPR